VKVLLTGFEPIWGIRRSPSGDLAKLWEEGAISVPGVEVKGLVLPQLYGKCTEALCTEIGAVQPHAVLMFGATQKNDPLRIERFAINVERSPMGDNSRIPVQDRPVVRGGPAAYEPTIPIEHLVHSLTSRGVSSKPSYSAGTHVCNSLMYGVLHYLSTVPQPHFVAAGFMHVSFPNDFGVVEDELWSTASFSGIVEASVALVAQVSQWYRTMPGSK
jgi:pyroglutamyl-peptidase